MALLRNPQRELPPEAVHRRVSMVGLNVLDIVIDRLVVDSHQLVTDLRHLVTRDLGDVFGVVT